MVDISVVGYQRSVLFLKETVWGTAVTPSKDLGLIQNITENSKNTLNRIFTLADIDAQSINAGTFEQNISLDFAYQNSRIFEFIMGSVSHLQSTNDWEHTFTEANALPSMTLGLDADLSTDIVKRYAGTKTGSVSASLALDGVLSIRADMLAKTVADSTTATASVISTLPTLPALMGTIQTGTAGSETTLTEVQNIETIWRTDPARIFGLGNRLPTALELAKRQYEINFSTGFTSVTEYERFLGSTSPSATSTPTIPSIVMNITNGTALGSGRRAFYWNLRGASYDTFSEPTNVDGFIISDFTAFGNTAQSMVGTDNISNSSF